MKRAKRFFKVLSITLALLISIIAISCASFYYAVTSSVSLDKEKLNNLSAVSLEIFDKNKISLKPTSENYVSIKNLKSATKNAFISAEDKRFYNHKGLDFIRIGGAMVSNIKSHSFSEGASTISQQLIKNTMLSSEKTISRKLKEIKLTKKLEKEFSKDYILELYLNNIYFGNGCYGIENASNHYFSKSAKDLSLAESALLAGTINAPSIYDIEFHTEKALERRNLILKLMKDYGHISKSEYEKAKNEEIKLNLSKLSNSNYLYNEIIEEACKILKISENELKNSNLKIYTYIDLPLQNQINSTISNSYGKLESSPNVASIVAENETNGIVAICGSKKTLSAKRQPGSTIKPILVYAPAIENNIVSPATKIVDEKINIGGYSPENADKTFHGNVSVKSALKNSYNVPAVKLLNELGIKNAQDFAKKMGIEFSDQDNNLAIALGGFTDGVKLSSLVGAYQTFANGGNFSSPKFISKIIKNHNTIYTNNSKKTNVMKDSTAYLITNMLTETSTSGTAKRLKDFDFEIASKTGTVGLSSSKKNTDAYNISYTSEHTILSYFGGTVMPENINGATYPTMLTKDVLTLLYKNHKPSNFTKPTSVVSKKISKINYEKNIITTANENEEFLTELFSKDNLPKQNNNIDFELQIFNFENKKPIITFNTSDNFEFKIMRKKDEEKKEIFSDKNLKDNIVQTNENKNDQDFLSNKKVVFEDKTAKSGEIYEYFVEFCEKNTNFVKKSNIIKLKSF